MTLNQVLNSYRKGVQSANDYIGVSTVNKLMGPYRKITLDIKSLDENNDPTTLIHLERTDKITMEQVGEVKGEMELQALEQFFNLIKGKEKYL